ncbi:hypothetical protein GCM10022416_25480 [Actinomadura keratinilytica]|uniref:Uncharacterized protein n=1 Tax=Actinomadura keratinilytica TaxID=547461 RepID=A0ABP7YPK1_9ACTN
MSKVTERADAMCISGDFRSEPADRYGREAAAGPRPGAVAVDDVPPPAPSRPEIPGLAPADWGRLETMEKFIAAHTTESALRAVLPPDAHGHAESLARHTRFDHGALLVFPGRVDTALAELEQRGLTAAPAVPSTVVRGHLAKRYGVPRKQLPVVITQVRTSADRSVELFLLPPQSAAAGVRIVADERSRHHQTHLGFRVTDPGEGVLGLVWDTVAECAGLAADGGGFNPHQGRSGCTVLYFRGAGRMPAPYHWPRRLEILVEGHHPRILRRHRRGI